jgi:hypothetical protein
MHVPEQGGAWPVAVDHCKQLRRTELSAPRLDVIEQLGDRRGNVGAQHVHLPKRRKGGAVFLGGAQVRAKQ